MHTTGEVEKTDVAKPEIIKYYNKTKGGVDVMDKMLAEYTVKRRTNRWTLAFFYNIIDVAGLASYIIHMEHNTQLRSTDRRRKFLKNLANELCMPAIITRSNIPTVVKNNFVRHSIELALGRQITESNNVIQRDQVNRDTTGRIQCVGYCYVCRMSTRKQRKTRKACSSCEKPICNEHSINKPVCDSCKNVTSN